MIEFIRNIVRKSLLKKVDNSRPLLRGQILSTGELSPQDTVILYPFGITGNPPINSMGVTFSANGYQEMSYSICYPQQNLPTGVEEGETVIYNDFGATIKLDKSNNIIIDTAAPVTVNAKDVNVTASDTVNVDAATVNIDGTAVVNIDSSTAVNLGTATALALNQNAVILDSVSGLCTISAPGQIITKV